MGEPELAMRNTKPMTMILEMLFSPTGCVRQETVVCFISCYTSDSQPVGHDPFGVE